MFGHPPAGERINRVTSHAVASEAASVESCELRTFNPPKWCPGCELCRVKDLGNKTTVY